EAAAARSREVDLHHDGHRPGEPLVDAEQQVGGDDEPPGGREPDQQWHRQRHQPADHEQPLASDSFRQVAGGQVRERLGDAEGDHEGEDRGARAQSEFLLPDEREHAPPEPDHGADEGIQPDEERELARVRAQAEPDAGQAGTPASPTRFAATIRFWSAGRGGMSASRASAKASGSAYARSGVWARSKPIDENGVPEGPRPQTEPP